MIATLNHRQAEHDNCADRCPFLLENESAYQDWRRHKLERREASSATHLFELDGNDDIPSVTREALKCQVEAFGFFLFESRKLLDKRGFGSLNRQFGLCSMDANAGADQDGITSLQVVGESDARAQYIPYTNRPLKWHTDGYYNPHQRRINAFALYCVNPAQQGGGNYLFDHEWMYLLIRDQSPDLLSALMSEDMMQIPANLQDHRVVRAQESGPVFSVSLLCGGLNMRYSSRPRNIVWKTDARSQRALSLIREILLDADAMVEISLRRQQGLVCNNVLHGRQAFSDREGEAPRLLYRARYHDCIDLEPAPTADAASSG